jgi:hypothetical protein
VIGRDILVTTKALATALVASIAEPKTLPLRKRLLSLDWARAQAAFERRQGQARQHQQTR